MRSDILIHNGTVITVNPDFEIIEKGAVAIRDGKIISVGAMTDGNVPTEAGEVIDAGGGLVLPGLINAHTHLPMTLFRGLADDLPLDEWLNGHIFPAEAAYIQPESVRWATLLGCAEMLLSGTTTCCDGYFYEGTVAEAVEAVGMRTVAGHGVIDFPAPGVPDPAENVATALQFAEAWMGRSPRVTPSIFCHSPYTCSAETLKRAKAGAREHGLLFQIHVAETRGERENRVSESGVSPVKYLDQLGVLDERSLLVHCVWTDDEDIRIIADRGAAVAHCPESNMKLASGIAPVPAFLDAGITVGLGTDGCASNNDLDIFGEMDTAAKLHKVSSLAPTVADARKILRMATIEGAKAVGLGDAVGSLEVGKRADVIVINTRKPHLTPVYHPESHLVYAVSGADVRDVVVEGKCVVRNRGLRTVDIDEIMDGVLRLAGAIKKQP